MFKNFLNISFLFFIFLSVKFNLLLLNEESLILFCFVLFCFLSITKVGPLVSEYFKDQTLNIQKSFVTSTQQVLEITQKNKSKLDRIQTWPEEFNKLRVHLQIFNISIIKKWPEVYSSQVKFNFFKKLTFVLRLEQQLSKLASLLIVEKTKKNISTQQFCLKKLSLKRFKHSEKMYLREHLAKVS